MSRTRHIRRPSPTHRFGQWQIRCDCGWSGSVAAAENGRALAGWEIEEALESRFVAHLPEEERELYILVDQRTGHVGNWIMPGGYPCLLVNHFDADGLRMARFMRAERKPSEGGGGFELKPTGETGLLPIGEIRTADNRVFRLNADA